MSLLSRFDDYENDPDLCKKDLEDEIYYDYYFGDFGDNDDSGSTVDISSIESPNKNNRDSLTKSEKRTIQNFLSMS